MLQVPSAQAQEIVDQYRWLMVEVRRRTDVLDDILARKVPLPLMVAWELAQLQIRKIAELIALGALVAHGDVAGVRNAKLKKATQADYILNALERLNPKFYPHPQMQTTGPDGERMVVDITQPYLRKVDLIAAYRETGEALHRGSISKITQLWEPEPDMLGVSSFLLKTKALLSEHWIQLQDPRYALVAIMVAQDGETHTTIMGLVE